VVLALDGPLMFPELHPDPLCELDGSLHEVVALLEGLGYRLRKLGGSPISCGEITF
jgi:hypothetical protein